MKGITPPKLWTATALAVILTLALPWTAFAAVWTDQEDYSPGDVVTIHGDNSDGAGYLAGETVHVDVNGPNGYIAACDAVADADGAWSCQVVLWPDYLAVGTYFYTAIGQTSSVSQTGTFTDGNATVTGYVKDASNNPIAGATVACTAGCNSDHSTTTDLNGYYAFSGANNNKLTFSGTSATLTLTASKSGYTPGVKTLSVTNGGTFNNTNFTLTVSDTTPPVITPSVSPAPNANGWNNTNVTVSWSVSDPESGIASSSGCGTTTLTTETAGTTLTCSATNGAGMSNSASVTVKIDKTAPQLTGCDTPDGLWHANNVTLYCTYTDGGSGPASQQVSLSTSVAAGNETANAVASAGGAKACDAAGNCTASPADIAGNKVDRKAPQLSSCDSPDGLWHANNVTLYCTYTDGGSGPAIQDVSLSTSVAAGTETANAVASAGGAQACDAVGNCAASPADISGNKIDKKAPSITWYSGINDGDSFYYGDVPAAPTCTATDSGSGPKSCAVSDYSAEVGPHTLTATAYDNVDNKAEETRSYTVLAWTLHGFYQPVDMGEIIWNTVKGGSTVPLKFEVFKGTIELTDVSAVKSFSAAAVACPLTGYVADEIEFTTTGGTVLRYDFTAGQFIQNWQTPKKAGACYKVTLTTKDGSSLSANFKLK